MTYRLDRRRFLRDSALWAMAAPVIPNIAANMPHGSGAAEADPEAQQRQGQEASLGRGTAGTGSDGQSSSPNLEGKR